mgnify:CR=1 FL=1
MCLIKLQKKVVIIFICRLVTVPFYYPGHILNSRVVFFTLFVPFIDREVFLIRPLYETNTKWS